MLLMLLLMLLLEVLKDLLVLVDLLLLKDLLLLLLDVCCRNRWGRNATDRCQR